MAGEIYKFGSTILPDAAATWDDAPTADTRLISTLGGAFNAYRGDTAPVKLPRPVTVDALVVSATAAELGQDVDSYRSLLGVRDRLWMHPFDSTIDDRWCWATLRQVGDRASYRDRRTLRLPLIFDIESLWQGQAYGGAVWDTGAHLFSNGLYYLTGDEAAPGSHSLDNDGNRTATNIGILYTCNKSGGVTNLIFTASNCQFAVSSLAQYDELLIDTGLRSITINGVDAYDRFSLGGMHASSHWLEISAGGETVAVTNGDASDRVQFVYADAWT